eukprot:3200378-Prymnesium_polylepis.1
MRGVPCGMRALHAVHLEKFDSFRAISIVSVGRVRLLCRASCTGVGVASKHVGSGVVRWVGRGLWRR